MIRHVLNFNFSFFPLATLTSLAYKIWERKRVPAGFPQFFLALVLTFISSFQTFILVLCFEYLYDYVASIATIVFWVGVISAMWGFSKIGGEISRDLRDEIRKVIKLTVLISLAFVVVYYFPICFKPTEDTPKRLRSIFRIPKRIKPNSETLA